MLDTTGFFGPAGANVFLSNVRIGLYSGSGYAPENLGVIDPVGGTFAMNWGGAATFNVLDATGTNTVGTGELLLVSPERGSYDPTTGVASSQTLQSAPAIMLLHNQSGGLSRILGIKISNTNIVNTSASATGISGTFAPQPQPDLTVILPPTLGGGRLLATLSGTAQFATVATPASTNPLPVGLTALNATATPFGNPSGTFAAVDASGFFGPAGGTVQLSGAQIGLYAGSGSPSANMGVIDPVGGTFAMNWGAVAMFNVLDAKGQAALGSGELLLVSPESGAFDPTTGIAISQTAGPVPASMLLHNNAGASAKAVGVTVNNYNKLTTAKAAAGIIAGTFTSNSAPDLTIGLPQMLGGGTLSAALAGTVQFTTANYAITSSNQIPITLTAMNAIATPAGSSGAYSAVDVTGFFGPTGASVLIGPAQVGVFAGSGLGFAGQGYLDPVAGKFLMNWGGTATFNILDATGTTTLGTGELLVVSPETGDYNPTTGVASSLTAAMVPATMILRNSGGDARILHITINNYNQVTTGSAAASVIPGTFTPHGAPDLTVALPAMLGGGTLLANLAGTVQFSINPATITSTNEIPIALTAMNASGSPQETPGECSPPLTPRAFLASRAQIFCSAPPR